MLGFEAKVKPKKNLIKLIKKKLKKQMVYSKEIKIFIKIKN